MGSSVGYEDMELIFILFKHKTAYEMRMSEWSSDVGSSDLEHGAPDFVWYVKRLSGNDTLANKSNQAGPYIPRDFLFGIFPALDRRDVKNPDVRSIGRASCRERVCQYVSFSVDAAAFMKKHIHI